MTPFLDLKAWGEYWEVVEEGYVGDPPQKPWWRKDDPKQQSSPIDPDVYQQASNLSLFKILFRDCETIMYYGTDSKERVQLRLMGRFEDEMWQECEKICPLAVLEEYRKYYRGLPEFPEYDEDREPDLDL